MLKHYIPVGKERLRCGYTTGTCAAAAARGAAERLRTGHWPEAVELTTPAGVPVRSRAVPAGRAAPSARTRGTTPT